MFRTHLLREHAEIHPCFGWLILQAPRKEARSSDRPDPSFRWREPARKGLDRGRSCAMCDDVAKFACHGQGHCHTVSSTMAAFLRLG